MNINITNFKAKYSLEVLNLINSQDSELVEKNTITQNLFTQMISIPYSNPENDCYLIWSENNLIGFVQLIHENTISRTVLNFWICKNVDRKSIFSRIIELFQKKLPSMNSKILHIQIPQKTYESILIENNWTQSKTYLTLKLSINSNPEISFDSHLKVSHLNIDSNDEKDLTNLQNACFENNWGFCPNTTEQIAYRVRMENCSPSGIIFIESNHTKIAYTWTLFDQNNQNNKTGFISMIGVHPKFQGKGIGKQVLLAGIKSLYQQGARSILLEVDSDNKNAISLYKKIGFMDFKENIWFEFN